VDLQGLGVRSEESSTQFIPTFIVNASTDNKKQNRLCTYKLILMRARATIFAVEKQ
jgi:hypothetical protein